MAVNLKNHRLRIYYETMSDINKKEKEQFRSCIISSDVYNHRYHFRSNAVNVSNDQIVEYQLEKENVKEAVSALIPVYSEGLEVGSFYRTLNGWDVAIYDQGEFFLEYYSDEFNEREVKQDMIKIWGMLND